MKRRIPLLVVVALALVAYGVYRVRQAGKPFEWSGTVEARTIEVGSRVGGRVEQVHVREGDSLKPGQTLITLEKVASRTLPTARRAEIAEAQARVQAQAATAEKAKMDQARFRKLFEGGAGTRADADNATLAARNADAQSSALRAQLDVLLHGTPQDVKSAEGLVEAARGRLQQIDVALDELAIRAPRAVRVEALDLRPGDILAPNAPAARLLEPAELYVRIYVPETQIGHVHPGQQVPITVDSFPGRSFAGRVESVASEGEFTPRNLQTADERADQVFATRVRIEDGADVLRAGMAAMVRVPR